VAAQGARRLPKVPAANSIDVGADGRITGLF